MDHPKHPPDRPHCAGYEHEGISFTLDPIYKDPTDPTWRLFIKGAYAYIPACLHACLLSFLCLPVCCHRHYRMAAAALGSWFLGGMGTS